MPEPPVYVRGRLSRRGIQRLRRCFAFLYGLFADVEVRGLENLPPEGGFLVATNHLSRLDPPLIFFTLPGFKMTVFAANSYRHNPLFNWVLTSVDAIYVNRGATSPSTIKAALQALRGGSVLGLAPEGTRSRSRALQRGRTGAAYLALAAGVPIVPTALTNTDRLFGAMLRFRRVRLTVTYGPAFRLAEPGQRVRPDAEQLEQATDEIMCRIAALLPPEYRGVYADHPRLRELLATQASQA